MYTVWGFKEYWAATQHNLLRAAVKTQPFVKTGNCRSTIFQIVLRGDNIALAVAGITVVCAGVCGGNFREIWKMRVESIAVNIFVRGFTSFLV